MYIFIYAAPILAVMPKTGSCQAGLQRRRVFRVGGVKPLGKPARDRRQELVGFGAPVLLDPKPGEIGGGANLPALGVLLAGDSKRLLQARLDLGVGSAAQMLQQRAAGPTRR